MRKNKENSEEIINPYEVDKLSKIPSWVIIIFLKYWAAAAASFLLFGLQSLGIMVTSSAQTDEVAQVETTVKILVMLTLFTAVLMNYVVRVVVRLLYNRRNNTYRYNLINCKGFKSFILALLYSAVVTTIMFFITYWLSSIHAVFDPFGTTGGIGIEPFTYGLWYMIVDSVFVIAKDLILEIRLRTIYKRQIQGV